MASIRLGILTDNRILGEGLHRILGAEPDVGPVDLVLDPAAFLAPANGDIAGRPEVLVVDGGAPEHLQWCGRLARMAEQPAVVVIGVRPEDDGAAAALRAGARGIVCKGASAVQLVRAIRAVHEGVVWAPQSVLERALDVPRAGDLTPDHDAKLTRRELEIAREAATGMSNKEIAGRLSISEATVKAHLSNIFRKLKVRDRLQLVFRYHDLKRGAVLIP
jgi:DNA-binding NarL/FixJ family response regulator